MRRSKAGTLCGAAAAVLFTATAAHASVEISSNATSNMNCSAGVCSPTAKKAVLNVTDLTNMLSAGDVKITTGNGAVNIVVNDAMSWTSTSRLTLDAIQSVKIYTPVTVAGAGAVTIATGDGGHRGKFIILPEQGRLQFLDLSSSLTIDGNNYTLVGDIKALASDIVANPSGFYALASDYDASVDGTYAQSPISSGAFTGIVDGLGNAIVHLRIEYKNGGDPELGLFNLLFGSTVRNVGVVDAKISSSARYGLIGALAGLEAADSTVFGCYSSGEITSLHQAFIGGLIGEQSGTEGHKSTISRSHSSAKIAGYDQAYGGLVGIASRDSSISESFATGNVSGGNDAFAGGLVGAPSGHVSNSYAFGAVTVGGWDGDSTYPPAAGGLVGQAFGGAVEQSYSIGAPHGETTANVGGMIGYGGASVTHAYWDIDTSGQNESAGGVGVSDAQLKAELPEGFDPKIWGQSPSINNGYPYLIANPPPQ